MKSNDYDVIVFGGGLVGAAAALGFMQKDYRVAIVEPSMPEPLLPASAPDLRVSAISYGSGKLLHWLDAWQHLDQSRIQPYTQLAVWEHEQFATEFKVSDVDLPFLGHLLENRNLQLALHQAIASFEHQTDWYQQGEVLSAEQGTCIIDGKEARAKLIVAADGAFSPIRRATKMGETGWQYAQSVFAIGIQTEEKSLKTTFQQFSQNGPMAYLPLFDNYAALVWYTPVEHLKKLRSLSITALKTEIVRHFPPLHSDFKVLDSASFAIRRNHANVYFQDKVVLCGDAAHTINPLAGQGVNIGFQDVQALLQLDPDKDLNSQLAAYQRKRRPQNLAMMSAMDAFSFAFSNNHPLLKLGRNLGLKLANHAGPLKELALKRALGI